MAEDASPALSAARAMLLRGVSPETVGRATRVPLDQVERMAMEMAYDSLCEIKGANRATHGVSPRYAAEGARTRAAAERMANHATRMQGARPQSEAELQALIAAAAPRVRVLPPGEALGATPARDRARRWD